MRIGQRVMTPDGSGKVMDAETFRNDKIKRYGVNLDKPHAWIPLPYYYEHEIKELGNDKRTN